MIYISQKNLRNYVKLELTESAKEKLNQVADSRDMKLMGVSSRIIEWFVQQDQLFQSIILGQIPATHQLEVFGVY